MLEVLHELVEEVNKRGHLDSLIKGVKSKILLSSENEYALLLIENGKLEVSEFEDCQWDAAISGNNTVLFELLTGQIKLRKASKNQQLELRSRVRTALFLESLFFLAFPNAIKKTEISKLLVD